ncbi:hypothetical protein [Opitutus sp. ER46]|uniref:hypothetical protein n=1 Tax=Opitutus sp. ER46 TaxID=2161864 RepID=UPI000D320DF7|nr:hypothetical protein [Opitutus sp. ER46]PTX99077.1 hypothetical protein DB354_03430 [Opitutus sp. ER46]
MNPVDRINQTSRLTSEVGRQSANPGDSALCRQTAEDFVAIQNRLAAHPEELAPTPQMDSIFDQLRKQLAKG